MASSAASSSKRRRLASIIGLRGVSGEALSTIIRAVHVQEIQPMSRHTIESFVKNEYSRVAHSLELPLQSGGVWKWDTCRADLLIRYFVEASNAFKRALTEAASRAGTDPLRLILYLDEVVPGNVLRPENHRKFWAVYVGIADLGQAELTHEEFWLPVAIIRSSVVQGIKGGLSNTMRCLLRSILMAPANLAGAGMAIDLDGPKLLRFNMSEVIADESALKSLWGTKGASGTKPCFYCSNCVSISSNLAEEDARLIDARCADANRFVLYRDKDLWKAHDNLESSVNRLTQNDFATLQQASGNFGWTNSVS